MGMRQLRKFVAVFLRCMFIDHKNNIGGRRINHMFINMPEHSMVIICCTVLGVPYHRFRGLMTIALRDIEKGKDFRSNNLDNII